MTSHDEHTHSLGAYLAGALSPAERSALDKHLAGCAACRKQVATLAPVSALLHRLRTEDIDAPRPAAPDALRERTLERLRSERNGERRRLKRWKAAAAVAAAALAAAVTIATLPGPAGVAERPLRLTATADRVQGTITAQARPWGTAVMLKLRHLPPSTSYVAVAFGKDGTRSVIATWAPTPDHDADVIGATDTHPDQLASIQVITAAGTRVATAQP